MFWGKTCPNPRESPARHARSLFIGCPQFSVAGDPESVTVEDPESVMVGDLKSVMMAGLGWGDWIQAFSGVASLTLDTGKELLDTSKTSLSPFRKFSPTLNSLRVSPIILPSPQLFDLIRSSPLLKDLDLTGIDKFRGKADNHHAVQTIIPSTSPPFTGSLALSIRGGLGNTARQLLELPNGLHFRRLTISRHRLGELGWMAMLVEECSHTLESLHVAYSAGSTFVSRPHLHQLLTPVSSFVGVDFD